MALLEKGAPKGKRKNAKKCVDFCPFEMLHKIRVFRRVLHPLAAAVGTGVLAMC
jgi:hypothetical protein